MATIKKSIHIKAPAKKVFEVVTSPDNWTSYVTSLVAIKDQSKELPAEGGTFKWEYKMLGFKITGKGEVTNYEKNRSFAMRLTGRATIEESYGFSPNPDGTTTLEVGINYTMPNQVLQSLMNTKLVEKLNAIESRNVMEKIKAMCEG